MSAEAELLKADLMKKADPDKMSSAVSQQVALLGSRSMYERINNNFKELEFEPLLAKEHHVLYKWREEYFFSQFGECPSCDENSCWFSEGFSWDDKCYCDDTFCYQVTVNFDEVVALACGPRPALPNRIFFKKFPEFEIDSTNQYDGILIKNNWTWFLDIEIHFRYTYSHMLHVFFALFQSKPLTLKLLAMRKALELKLEVKDGNLPSQLRFKECAGSQEIFTTADQIMPFIAEKDRGKLEELKRKFGRD